MDAPRVIKGTTGESGVLSRHGDTVPGVIYRAVVGALLGGAAGFAMYRFVGCSTGACPLTSNPFISTVYGAVIGLLAVMG